MSINSQISFDGRPARVNEFGWLQVLSINASIGAVATILSQTGFSVDVVDANGGGADLPLFYMSNLNAELSDILFVVQTFSFVFDANGDVLVRTVEGTPTGGVDAPVNNQFVGALQPAIGEFLTGSPIGGLTNISDIRNVPVSSGVPTNIDIVNLPIVLPPGRALAVEFSRSNPTFSLNVGFIAIDPGVLV